MTLQESIRWAIGTAIAGFITSYIVSKLRYKDDPSRGGLPVNRWILTDAVRDKYKQSVQDFINDLEAVDIEEATDFLEKDFSDTELNPATLEELLEKEFGYEVDERDDNGWELDFWITMRKSGYRPISICGCGMTFELKLSEIEE